MIPPRFWTCLEVMVSSMVAAISLQACGDSGAMVDEECLSGFASCGHSCVDLGYDTQNCGQCGIVCTSAAACVRGACQTSAADGAAEAEPADGPIDAYQDSLSPYDTNASDCGPGQCPGDEPEAGQDDAVLGPTQSRARTRKT